MKYSSNFILIQHYVENKIYYSERFFVLQKPKMTKLPRCSININHYHLDNRKLNKPAILMISTYISWLCIQYQLSAQPPMPLQEFQKENLTDRRVARYRHVLVLSLLVFLQQRLRIIWSRGNLSWSTCMTKQISKKHFANRPTWIL